MGMRGGGIILDPVGSSRFLFFVDVMCNRLISIIIIVIVVSFCYILVTISWRVQLDSVSGDSWQKKWVMTWLLHLQHC